MFVSDREMRFMGADLRVSLAISLLSLLWVSGLAVVPSKDSLGIAPQDKGYYESSVIQCKDGSKKFTKEKLNDEFCDCPDGTDEPGTSACPEGKFYCRNEGHIPLTIFSSRVNDGICDCCDGSDEYQSGIKCPNTCWKAGKAAQENLKKEIATYLEGVKIRKKDVEKATNAFAKDEADLAKLKAEEESLRGIVQKLKENKERIDLAEEEERKRKEEEKRLREEGEKANEQEIAPEETLHGIDVPHELSASPKKDYLGHSHDTSVSEMNHNAGAKLSESHKGEQHVDGPPFKTEASAETESKEASPEHVINQAQGDSIDAEKLSKEELGRLVASRWTGENAEQKMDVETTAKEEHNDDNNPGTSNSASVKGSDDGYTSGADIDRKYDGDDDDDGFDDDDDDDDDDDGYEDDHGDTSESFNPDDGDEKTEFSDFNGSSTSSWLEKLQQTIQNVLQAFNFFKTPVDVSEGARLRKEYDDLNSKLSKLRSRISSLIDKLKHDFGKEKEFYSFYSQCFESKQNKYVYKVCPFKQATQVEGHSTTRLGNWDKFEDSYTIMQFSIGDKCWNGPHRSLKVRLHCGLKNELTDMDEPSRCEYIATLSTPAVCTEEKLEELQKKLDQMNSNQPSSHDEL